MQMFNTVVSADNKQKTLQFLYDVINFIRL